MNTDQTQNNQNTLQTFGTEAIQPWLLPLQKPWVTNSIIVINALVFIAMAVDSGGASIMKPSSELLVKWQLDWGPLTLDGEPWRLLTSCFVHIGIVHILCNMVILSRVGATCELLYGRMKFLVLYVLTGIAASICSLMINVDGGSVGASGAICGLIGAYAAFITLHQKDFEPKVFVQSMKQVGVYIGCCVVYGFFVHADLAAHIGGILSGFALGAAMSPDNNVDRKLRPRDLIGIIALLISMFGLFYLEDSGTFDKTGNLTISKASNAFRRDNDLSKALLLIESPQVKDVDTAIANQIRASLYLEADQIEKAKPAVEKLVKEKADDPTALQLATEIEFLAHDYAKVIELTNKMMQLQEGQTELGAYPAFANYFASRRLGVKDADQKLNELKVHLKKTSWPYKVASYLDGSMPEKEFMESAGTNDEKTESHAYAGLMKLQDGKREEAKELFEWIVKNGTRNFIEYHYAVGALNDLRQDKR